VISVLDTTVKLVAATAPKATRVAPLNPVPVMVTVVPPVVGPDAGVTAVVTATGASALNSLKAAPAMLVPPAVVTYTGCGPGSWAGVTAVTTVSDTTVKRAATAVPKRTFPVPMNPDPVIVTKVPPASGPEAGATDVTTGVGASYVN